MDKKKRMWLWVVIVVIVVAVIIIGIIQYGKHNASTKIDSALKPDVSAPAKSPDFKPKEGAPLTDDELSEAYSLI